MKSFITLLLGMLCHGNAISQLTPIHKLVKIKLPKDSEKLSHKQLQSYWIDKEGFNQKRDWTPKGDVYRINSMVLQLNGAAISRPDKLENSKKSWDATMSHRGRRSPGYTSEIKAINNYKVLIMHHQGKDFASYSFFSVNNSNTKVLNGKLEYNKSDTANKNVAANTLNKLLGGMKFK